MVKQTQTPSSLNYVDELDCGSFFDQIDDLIDFPSDDEEPIASEGKKYEDGSSFTPSSIWAGQPGSDSVFSTHCGSDLSAELSVPYEDILQLEWLSTFVEDSFSGGGGEGEGFLTMSSNNNNNNNEIECSILDKDLSPSTMLSNQQFMTSSPISVLESTSFCSRDQKPLSTKKGNVGTKKRGRPRSKRTCPSTYASRPQMQHKSEQKLKNKRIKVTPAPHSHAGGMDEQNNQDSAEQKHQGVRKCTHCQVTKTPQWRAGPTGAKTLCNACGMRYKSGRLLPEYRPAASPTYVPSLHSNSHRKVLEMRIKTTSTTSGDHDETLRITDGSTASMIAHSPELLIPNHNSNLYM